MIIDNTVARRLGIFFFYDPAGIVDRYVDYFVSDNAAVSRSHANIVEQNGKFYVVDTNSTNHTYVNGRMIQSNTEVLLSHGDRVRLANEEFEFHMM